MTAKVEYVNFAAYKYCSLLVSALQINYIFTKLICGTKIDGFWDAALRTLVHRYRHIRRTGVYLFGVETASNREAQ
jgi:hypothetical protein